VEQYLRSFGEDDLAFLANKVCCGRTTKACRAELNGVVFSVQNEDPTPFDMPALGRWYQDVWAEEDAFLNSPSASPAPFSSSTGGGLEPPPLGRFRPSDLTDDSVATENVFLGPLAERVAAALSWEGVKRPQVDQRATEPETTLGADEGGLGGLTGVNIDTTELEERLRRELRYLGVFADANSSSATYRRDGDVDWSQRQDDEISASLRACQRQLRDQMEINEARKARLAEVVRDRMAYQEYEGLRDSVEKEIEAGWAKLQRAVKRKAAKAKERGSNTVAAGTPSAATPTSAAAPANGVVTRGAEKEQQRVPVSDSIVSALEKRRRFVDSLAPLFDDAEPGRFRGFPTESIYGDDPLTRTTPSEAATTA
jgi:transcriptional adapter 3